MMYFERLMIDVRKQIEYWRNGAAEDWDVALHLLDEGRVRHALFLLHLAVEKILKAHVCGKSGDVAPRTHNLLQLAEAAGLVLQQEDLDFLGELSLFNIEGRYPGQYEDLPPQPEVKRIRGDAERIYRWLHNQL